MNRYGMFDGTDRENKYINIGRSEGIYKFISDIGATSVQYTIDEICKVSAGFTRLPGYMEQPENKRPVAVRYIPMHLGKRDDMPKSMKPVYTLSIIGDENSERAANYHCTVVMDESALLGQKNVNYLTQIFGTPLVSWQEIKNIRENQAIKKRTDWALTPEAYIPNMIPEDRNAVLAAVNAIYDEKCVFIKLEKGCVFNDRSFEILGQIYSMLQPKLAAEVGFASYQATNGIYDLINKAGIKIFVLTHDAELPRDSSSVLLDLNHPETIRLDTEDKRTQILWQWYSLGWEKRREAMDKLFRTQNVDFKDPDTFVRISQELFEGDFVKWVRLGKGIPEAGTITDLVQLKAKYDSFPILKYNISWLDELFGKMVKFLVPSGSNINEWALEAQRAVAFSDGDAAKSLSRIAEFGVGIILPSSAKGIAGSVSSFASVVGKKVKDDAEIRTSEKKELEFKDERALAARKIQEVEEKRSAEMQEHQNQLNQCRLECEQALKNERASADRKIQEAEQKTREAEEKCSAEMQEHQNRLNQYRLECEQALRDKETEFGQKLTYEKAEAEKTQAAIKADYEQRLSSVENEARKRLSELQNQQKLQMAEAQEKIAEEQRLTKEKERAIEQLKDKLSQNNAAMEAALSSVREENANLRERYESSLEERKRQKLQLEEYQNGGAVKRLEAALADAKAGRDNAERELKSKSAVAQKKSNELNRELEKAKKSKLPFALLGAVIGAVLCFAVLILTGKLSSVKDNMVVENSPAPVVTEAPVPSAPVSPEPSPAQTDEPLPPDTLFTSDGQVNEGFVANNAPEVEITSDQALFDKTYVSSAEYEFIAALEMNNNVQPDAQENGGAEVAAYGETEKEFAVLLRHIETESAAEQPVENENSSVPFQGAALVLDNGDYCAAIYGGENFQKTVVALFNSVVADGEFPQVSASVSDGRFLNLTDMLVQLCEQAGDENQAEPTEGAAGWYDKLCYIASAEDGISQLAGQYYASGTTLAAIALDDNIVLVFSEGDEAAKTYYQSNAPRAKVSSMADYIFAVMVASPAVDGQQPQTVSTDGGWTE